MKDETLLSRAAYNYRLALKSYIYSDGDEREFNYIGYLLQQATELCIKHCLEFIGVRYPHTHRIEDLLDLCDTNKIQFSEDLYDFAPAITKWESQTHYIKNYTLAKRQIVKGFKLVKDLLIEKGCNEEDLKLPKIIKRDSSEMDFF